MGSAPCGRSASPGTSSSRSLRHAQHSQLNSGGRPGHPKSRCQPLWRTRADAKARGAPFQSDTRSLSLAYTKDMRITRRTQAIAFFISLSTCLVALATALNVGCVIFHWRPVVPLGLGIVLFVRLTD